MQFFSYQFSVRLKMLKLLLEWNCKVSKEGEEVVVFVSAAGEGFTQRQVRF